MADISSTRIVFMGTPAFGVPSLEELAHASTNIVGVFTQPEQPSGRGQRVQRSAVAHASERLGLPVFTPSSWKNAESLEALRALRPDLLVVVAYGYILPTAVLELPRFGAVNVHASLLPRFRGPAPIPASILAGDTETGVTIMRLDEGIDSGPIFAQERVPITNEDTTATLTSTLAARGANLLLRTLPLYLNGQITAQPQDHSAATYCRMVKKDDGRIDWSASATEVARKVRAYDPWPHAFTYWNKERIIIHRATPLPDLRPREPKPGTAQLDNGSLIVSTGAGALRIDELQRENRRRLSADAFLRGQPDFLNAELG